MNKNDTIAALKAEVDNMVSINESLLSGLIERDQRETEQQAAAEYWEAKALDHAITIRQDAITRDKAVDAALKEKARIAEAATLKNLGNGLIHIDDLRKMIDSVHTHHPAGGKKTVGFALSSRPSPSRVQAAIVDMLECPAPADKTKLWFESDAGRTDSREASLYAHLAVPYAASHNVADIIARFGSGA
jgi:hypothetical protein